MNRKNYKHIISSFLLCCMGIAFILNISQCLSIPVPRYTPIQLPPSTVSIVQSHQAKAEDITESEILSMVREAVDLAGGFEDLIKDGDVVVLKPNLVTINDYTLPGWQGKPLSPEVNGTTTDWRVTKAVVQLVREHNPSGKVYVMEGSSVLTKIAFRHHQYTHGYIPDVDAFIAIEEDSGDYRDKSSDKLVKVELEEGLLHNEYYVNKRLKEADVVITLPCLKNHWHAVITGAIKNMGIGATPANIYGIGPANPGRNNMVNHQTIDLHYWIHDYYMVRPVDFVIMDGLQGIQNGPTPNRGISGTTNIKNDQMNMRLILAGRDAVAVDTIESLIMSWDPLSVEYLCRLNSDGVGNIDTACITVKGKQVDEVRKKFKGRSINPSCKGVMISDTDAPDITITAAAIKDNILSVSILPDEDIYVVRFFLNDLPIGTPVREGFDMITVRLDESKKGANNLTVIACDKFLNSEKTTVALPLLAEGMHNAIKAYLPPVIDGRADDPCWKDASWYPIDKLWLGKLSSAEDFSGRFKVSWNDEKIFLLVEITDDILRDIQSNPLIGYWKDDCIEIFIDEDKSGGIHTYSYNAFAYHISLSYDVVDLHTDSQPKLYNDHIEVKRMNTSPLFTWEMAITIYNDSFHYGKENRPVKLTGGKHMGLAVAYCDNDKSDDRESFIGSVNIKGADKNRGWIDADVFGTLTLIE
jgi:uncharacterized protein (DUF362 family)